MAKRLVTGTALTLGIAAAVLLATAGPASAHIEGTATSTAAGSYTTMTFSVPHGCDGSPTTTLRFGMPDSVIQVTPTVNPNWTITKATEPYTSASASSDDETPADAGERVTSVTYTATTPLPADERDTFSLSFALPDGAAGDVVAFPVVQTCEQGSTDWDQAQKAGQAEPEHPAPSVTLTAADDVAADSDDHDHGAAAEPTTAASTNAAPADAGQDVVARFLGLGGLVVGAAGVVVAVAATRRRAR